ncbi:MAG TPA: ATP-binding protein [Bryobacteraceae bacterium]|nr:ATP-binding protein [Bryobacteraceae bacterium]
MSMAVEIARIRSLLRAHAGQEETEHEHRSEDFAALMAVCEAFHLSEFERDTLLLCAGMELDADFAPLCAAVQRDERLRFPTFRLALQIFPEAHWSALLPGAPLRRWKLLEIGAGETLTTSQLRIDESVLHFLVGVVSPDERLRGFVEPVAMPETLPESYRVHIDELIKLWTGNAAGHVVVHLQGNATRGKRAVAATACAAAGLRLQALRACRVPTGAVEQASFARLWEREAALTRAALLIEFDGASPAESQAAAWLADHVVGVVLVNGSGFPELSSEVLRVTIDRPPVAEQRALWNRTLGEKAVGLNGSLDCIAAQFSLDTGRIRNAGERAMKAAAASGKDLFAHVWDACRTEARGDLDSLAQRIETRAGWPDLILSENSMEMLRAISSHVRQQSKVLETWGFAAQSARGLGITALFTGPSGTGKTLAAEILANELRLDLYRIDLSQVVSKFIGETEKNLRSIFDAAENSGAVLLFDEADALFGKRSEVKDSHDRYANIEVSYLLQRMEAYRGLAVLTTNLRGALDAAFLRRIRFIVNFPFPDAALRRRIWERMFPPHTPTVGLDSEKLAKLNMPGGNIRNIALNAAFLAADQGERVGMSHLLTAARRECGKLDKPLSDAETGGWV